MGTFEKHTLEACHFERIKKQCISQYWNEQGSACMTRYIVEGRDDRLLLLLDKERGTFREILARDGHFADFPGIVYDEEWMRWFEYPSVGECVVFGALILKKQNGQYLFLWTIQPYAADPGDEWGFGADEQLKIVLYSILDADGRFTKPFELYSIGGDCYYNDPDGMKVVFLDFDGVLNSDEYVSRNTGLAIDPARLKLLKRLICSTGAKIVLSTSWREHWDLYDSYCDEIGDRINRVFGAEGLYIYDRTYGRELDRYAQITVWLATHPDTKQFVVLDDMPFEEGILTDHFVLTSSRSGITEGDVSRAIRILNA